MDKEITLVSFINLIKHKLKFIILAMLFVGVAVAGVRTITIEPTYQSTVDLILNPKISSAQQLTLNQLQTNEKLIKTYREIILSDNILNKVQDRLDSQFSNDVLRDKISVVTSVESQTFGIQVVDTSPQNAANLANTIADVFQTNINDYYSANLEIKVISTAKPALNRVEPNFVKDFVFGAIIGAVLSLFAFVVFELLKKSISDRQALTRFGWKDLGAVNIQDVFKKDLTLKNDFALANMTLNEIEGIQSKLALQLAQQETTAFMITDTTESSEKALFSFLLAKSFANSGKKTILIDANLKCEHLRNVLKKGHAVNNLSISDLSHKFDNIANFNSNELEENMEKLKERYDVIIWYVPTMVGKPDAQILATKIKNVLFFVKQEETMIDELFEAYTFLNNFNVSVLGYVFEEKLNGKG